MKKKLFTIALALCMILTMVPGGVSHSEAAWAANGNATEVKVAGVEMTNTGVTYYKIGQDGSSSNGYNTDYNVMYDKTTNTLTLKGLNYHGSAIGVDANGDLNIVVVGDNTITSTDYGIWTTGDLTISGKDKDTDMLTVKSSGENAIFAFENNPGEYSKYAESIHISHVSINALAENSEDVGICAPYKVTIVDSHVVSTGGMHGIQGGYFYVSGGGNGNRGEIIIANSVIKAKATSESQGAKALKEKVTVDGKNYNHNDAKIVNIPDVHKHCICGATHKEIGDHNLDTPTEFTEWTSNNSLPESAGNYYLTNNVTLSKTWKPANNTVLCLNGHDVICEAGTYESAVDAISVDSNVTFTLTDCSKDVDGNNKGKITHADAVIGRGVYSDGIFYLYGGNIADNDNRSNSFSGGGVQNHIGATFTMYGGSITGNKDENGAGVYNSVTESTDKRTVFTMYGGTISGNQANNIGGGVFNQGDFIMEGGTISNNQAIKENEEASTSGGGVYNASKGTFNFNGGAIIGNEADNKGGGVYNAYNATFTMTAGTITKNKVVAASSSKGDGGGGVYNFGTFTISNTAEISGNRVTDRDCYGGGVFNYGTFTMNGGTIGGSNTDDANSAGFGGGLHHGAGQAQLNGGMIQGNTATSNGGGVFYSKNITLSGVTITGNTANGTGGGAWMGVFDDIVMTVGGATTITGN